MLALPDLWKPSLSISFQFFPESGKNCLWKKKKFCVHIFWEVFFLPSQTLFDEGIVLTPVYLCIYLLVNMCADNIAQKLLNRFAWNFQGWCALTQGRQAKLLGAIGLKVKVKVMKRSKSCFRHNVVNFYPNEMKPTPKCSVLNSTFWDMPHGSGA